MTMKKLWSLILCVLLIGCFCSCDRATENDRNGGGESERSNQTESGALESSEDLTSDSEVPSHTHTAASAVKENEISPTCKRDGSYYEVVYCAECRERVSRVRKSTTKLPHEYEDGKCIHCGMAKPSEGLVFESNGNGTCSLSGIGTCTDKRIVIPTTSPSGDSVTAIAPSAFVGCESFETVFIPATVKIIGVDAFKNCSALQGVTFESASGWSCYDDDASVFVKRELDLTNEAKNALYLNFQFNEYTWKQN